jgi:hypothetical protein
MPRKRNQNRGNRGDQAQRGSDTGVDTGYDAGM